MHALMDNEAEFQGKLGYRPQQTIQMAAEALLKVTRESIAADLHSVKDLPPPKRPAPRRWRR